MKRWGEEMGDWHRVRFVLRIHTPEVGASIPPCATKEKAPRLGAFCFECIILAW